MEHRTAFSRLSVYSGTFLIAFTTLGLEISLTRLLSVTTWYYMAFFAISTSMLGMTAGAVTVYLKPSWFTPQEQRSSIARSCLLYALATPACLILLCLIPIRPAETVMDVAALMVATVCCSVPFYFSGIAVSAVLTRVPLPVGRVYASDMIGASLGALSVLAGVEWMDVPSLILVYASVGAMASLAFQGRGQRSWLRRSSGWVACGLLVFAVVNAGSDSRIKPLVVKGIVHDLSKYEFEQWNSFSRVAVGHETWSKPQMWGKSPRIEKLQPALQHFMDIDGEAGTTIRRFWSTADIDHLRYDITNVAYFLRPTGGACIIGVGGGRDVQSALLFGHRRVLGIEVNPIFIRLLTGRFREFAGLADRPEVRLVANEARSLLSRSDETFSIVQMSLIDTWAATGAGAFTLSENSLYTVEAWKILLDRLEDDGILTVSRWYDPERLGETGRLCSLAVASLLEVGVRDPSRHFAMLTTGEISTALVSRSPFRPEDIARLRQVANRLGYDLVVVPDEPPRVPVLKRIVQARSLESLAGAVRDEPYNFTPPTDDNPYFFNMLRLSHLEKAFETRTGVLHGNLRATVTLLELIGCLAFLAVATIVVPLLVKRRTGRSPAPPGGVLAAGAAYFSLIGAGFMFAEIGILQRLSVFLSHPVYALGVVLFTLIASTGIGSLLSERVPLTRVPFLYVLPLAAALLILAMSFFMPAGMARLTAAPVSVKALAAVAAIFPAGLLLGFFFPGGMRLAKHAGIEDTPWYWALNGIFGVLCSAIAVLVAINLGISRNFEIAAGAYAMLVLCVGPMLKAGQDRSGQRGSVS